MDEPPSQTGAPPQVGAVLVGKPPDIAGRDQIAARIRARLFGPTPSEVSKLGASSEAAGSPLPSVGEPVGSMLDSEPATVGRFRIIERLGRGGMGVVYKAHDPQLDRAVAVKLLRPEHGRNSSRSSGRARLLREAQAMARVSHPNVIAVHEVGTFGDQVFVAMEFAPGQSLARWMKTPRPWQEVLAVFDSAGRGLAAAHRQGLVHRDFKPDNVLVGGDGRVRVLDFGLARIQVEHAGGTAQLEYRGPASTSDPPDSLTVTGAVMGTPAYMSPEQFLGHPADARSDQFSFCVALYEALHNERPFTGTSLRALMMSVLRGDVRPPSQRVVPRWIEAAVLRGLSTRPDARFQDMDGLLGALDQRPRRRKLRFALSAGLVLMASGLTYGAVVNSDDLSTCDRVGDAIDEVWNDGRRRAVASALYSSELPYAEQTWDTTQTLLDRYAQGWRVGATEACAGALISTTSDVGPLRQDCLQRRKEELAQLVEVLSSGTPGASVHAVQAAATLSGVSDCADPRRLAYRIASAELLARPAIGRARAAIYRAELAGVLGNYGEAVDQSNTALELIAWFEDSVTSAAALSVRGRYEERNGQRAAAEATLREAVRLAELGGALEVRVQALIDLVWVVSRSPKRYSEALALGADAGAVLKMLGSDPLLRAKLDQNLGAAAKAAGDYERALSSYKSAVSGYEQVYGEVHPNTGRALSNLGTLLSRMRRTEEAQGYLERALVGMEQALGSKHPLVAQVLTNLGNNLLQRDRFDEAVAAQTSALNIRLESFPRTHPAVPRTMFNLASAFFYGGNHRQARHWLLEGVAARGEVVGPNDGSLLDWWVQLGKVELELGNNAQAVRWFNKSEPVLVALDDAQGLARLRFDKARSIADEDPVQARELAGAAIAALRPVSTAGEEVEDMQAWLAQLGP